MERPFKDLSPTRSHLSVSTTSQYSNYESINGPIHLLGKNIQGSTTSLSLPSKHCTKDQAFNIAGGHGGWALHIQTTTVRNASSEARMRKVSGLSGGRPGALV